MLNKIIILVFIINLHVLVWAQAKGMPLPFTRELYPNQDLNGTDVFIAQNLINRSPYVNPSIPLTCNYDTETVTAVSQFQKGNSLTISGIFDIPTANLLLSLHTYDGYKDNGTIPPGYKYKVYIPVHANRSIETNATLFDNKMNVLLSFTVRAHGQDCTSTGEPLNQFSGDGETPTGLSTFDLNSPEPDPISYGPYPINRFVQGLEGNALFLISNIRDGILLHTGQWPDWQPPMPMPNSEGCVHTYPNNVFMIWQILVSMGVQVRNNTFGKLPYPYKAQGIVSVEQID